MTTTSRVALCCLTLCLVAMLFPGPAAARHAAAQDVPLCDQVEIVFVVDQSGSMRGVPTDHPNPNDPNGLRFFAPLWAVRWMGQDYVGASGLGLPSRPVVTYHVALVEFGDDAQVRLPWTTIAPTDEQSWRNLDTQLSEALAPYDYSLGNTNVLAAMEVARDLFDQRSTVRDGCPKRAIFVLTDGMPYVKPADNTTGFSVTEHLGAMADLVANDLAQRGVGVWITAINDSNDNYWTRMEPIWQQMLPPDETGKEPRAWKVNTEDEIGQRFVNLMVELADRNIERPRLGPRCVPPYLQQIVLTFYKRDPSEHLDVSDPVGPLTPSRTDVGVEVLGYDEPIESLIVHRPLPGRWEINTTAPRADVLIDEVTLPAIGKLVQPSGKDAVQYMQDELMLQLVDLQGDPLPAYSDPNFGLVVEANVRSASQSYPFSLVDTAQGQRSGLFIPLDSGSHQLVVTAKSSTPQQRVPEPAGSACLWETTAVLDQVAVGEFSVAPVKLTQAGQSTLLSATGGNCPLQQGDQALVGYRWERVDNQLPVSISLPTVWEAGLRGPSSEQPVTVQGPAASSGVFTATLLFNEAGQHTLAALASARLPDGALTQALNDQQTFNVAPVQALRAQVAVLEPAVKPLWWRILAMFGLTPDEPGRQIARDPLWRLLPTELDVLVSLDGQTAADPSAALQIAPDQRPVQLILANADGTEPREIPLVPTNVPGRYHATLSDIPLGRYELRVAPISGLLAACGFSLPVSMQLDLARVENPIIYGELLLLALLLLVLALRLLYLWCRRRNPCQGYLAVVDSDGKLVDNWYKDLSGRNNWRLRRDLAPPAKCGIEEIRIHSTQRSCGRDPYPDNKVWVQVLPMTLGDRSQAPLEHEFRPREKPWKPEQLPYAIKYVLELKHLEPGSGA